MAEPGQTESRSLLKRLFSKPQKEEDREVPIRLTKGLLLDYSEKIERWFQRLEDAGVEKRPDTGDFRIDIPDGVEVGPEITRLFDQVRREHGGSEEDPVKRIEVSVLKSINLATVTTSRLLRVSVATPGEERSFLLGSGPPDRHIPYGVWLHHIQHEPEIVVRLDKEISADSERQQKLAAEISVLVDTVVGKTVAKQTP